MHLSVSSKRLEHSQECDGDGDCQLTDTEIYDGINLHYDGGKATWEEREEYNHEEEAQRAIAEDLLSLQVRSGWRKLGEEAEDEDFEILLCTGGPAVRIGANLTTGSHREPAWNTRTGMNPGRNTWT